MHTVRRGLVLGIAFGIAAATVEFWMGILPVLERGFGPGAAFYVRMAPWIIALGAVLGVATAPLLTLRGGRFLHLLALGLLWFAIERAVAIDSPLFERMVVVVPVATVILVGIGFGLARFGPRVPWIVGGLLFVSGIFAPSVALTSTRPAIEMRTDLPPAPAGAPDVVLVVLDTVRARNVSTYGYERGTAPGLDALAAESALFLDATSPSTWSLPSHASLFTGRYPSSHGAHAEHRYLDDRYPTLAQVLQGNGYDTFCITANAWISDGLGLTRGFGWQDESLRAQGGAGLAFSFIYRLLDRLGLQETDKGGAAVLARFEKWARERPVPADRPAFVFLNFIEAHFPYHQLPHEHLYRYTDRPYSALRKISIDLLGAQFGGTRPAADTVREPTVDMYDGGVAYTDALVARVVETLRERGTLDHTVLVVMADHGELLGERDDFFGHGPSLYQEAVGVPLLVRYPPKVEAGTRVETPVSTLGVFATIVDLADLLPPPTLQVGSLVQAIRHEASEPGPILSELHDAAAMGFIRETTNPQMRGGVRYRLYRDGNLKLVTPSVGEPMLYDLSVDPAETRDLAGDRPADLARMQAKLAAVQADLGLPDLAAALAVGEDAPELDDATRESLRALGYVE